jgi:hypothetical protein
MSGISAFERAGKVRRLAGPRPAQRPQKKPLRCCAPAPAPTADPAAGAGPLDAAEPAAPAPAARGHPAAVEGEGGSAAGAEAGEGRGAVVLEACKFVSKRSKEACPALPAIVCHKRGHLAVSCSAGHQVTHPPLPAPPRS